MNNESLTASQRRAIEEEHAQILCVAGPGSGKTTVLTKRIARLLNTIPASRIVAITYTNAAARNIEERLAVPSDMGTGDILMKTTRLGFCGTLHGFCLRMLKRHGGAFGYGERTGVIDEDASRELLESKAKSLGCKTSLDKIVEIKASGAMTVGSTEGLVISAYRDELRESGLLDFDLILTEFVRLIGLAPDFAKALSVYTHLFVDEVQDSALVDWRIFCAIPIANKFLVGDPDQGIFGFRGGRVKLLQMYHDSPGVMTLYLEENFRCAMAVCDAANALINRNQNRLPKLTVSAGDVPGKVTRFGQTVNEGDEVAQVMGYMKHLDFKPEQMAILARTNAIAANFRESLKAAGVAVTEPPKSELPKDWPLVRALVEMLAQPNNETLRFFYSIAFALHNGASALEARKTADEIRLRNRAAKLTFNALDLYDVVKAMAGDNVSLESRMLVADLMTNMPSGATTLDLALEVARKERDLPDNGTTGVTCTTIHAAKGREWDAVFLVGIEDEIIPGKGKDVDIEEERRLLFVGLTRARTRVFLSHAASRRASYANKPILPHTPSRFLAELVP